MSSFLTNRPGRRYLGGIQNGIRGVPLVLLFAAIGYFGLRASHADTLASPYTQTDGIYTSPTSNSAEWVASHPDDPRATVIKQRIADVPQATWVGPGSISASVKTTVGNAATAHKLPILVAYAIPNRDCGNYSAGGEPDTASYIAWAQEFAQAVGKRPAVLVIEPDAISAQCWTDERTTQIKGLIDAFSHYAPQTWMYIDAGDGHNVDPSVAVQRLKQVGMQNVRGVSVNVGNYNAEPTIRTYMASVDKLMGNEVPFIYDTSRNGKGPDASGGWCNPADRQTGSIPAVGGSGGLDASLWIKPPGESDGTCGVYPGIPSGNFDPGIAYDLIQGRTGAPL